MRTEYRLWHWPEGRAHGEEQGLYPTAEEAIASVRGWKRTAWKEAPRGGWYIPLPDGDRTGRYQAYAVSPELVPESLEDRVELAVQVLVETGQEDGDHHKMWTIDQALRILLGDRYGQAITDYCAGEDGPETYSWDVGIAP